MFRHIIAGIDPGATVGIAILDLSGKKLASESSDGGIAQAAAIIERHGTPSLICCDVNPAPEMARKLASYFSCRLYAPARSIREEEKREVARGTGPGNNHERDAYAAALFGFRSHANKLRQIDALAGLSPEEKERIKHLLLKGYRIADAFAALSGQNDDAGKKNAGKPDAQMHAASQANLSPESLRERISSLARENANLRLLAERLEDENRALAQRVRLLENGVRGSFIRDGEFRRLRYQLQLALSRLHERKNAARVPGRAAAQAEKKQEQKEGGILNVAGKDIDLEKMVMDYRKGRHKS